MSENPFEAQTNPYAGEVAPVSAKSVPSGLQFNLTLCLILAILGIVASCMGGCGLAFTELTQSGVFDGVNAPADLSPPAVDSNLSDEISFAVEFGTPSATVGSSEGINLSGDLDDPSAEVLEPSFEIAEPAVAESDFSLEAQLQEIGRDPVVRISNVVMFLLGLVTSIVLLLASIKGMQRKSGAPKAMGNALALAIFYKVLGIFLGILGCVISVRGMSSLELGDVLPPEAEMVLQIATWGVIGFTVFAIFMAALMAGYYVYARGVFKRSEVVAYFESK